jgi:hypothetical protein
MSHKGNIQPQLDLEEHTHISGVAGKKVFIIDSKGNVSDLDQDLLLNVQTDSGDANVQYIGKADIGSATSEAVWQIKKVNSTTGSVITFADGNNNYDNVFDNRESLSYS